MSQNPNPEQYNQYSQQAPSYSQAPGQQPNGYVVSSKDDQNMAMLAHLASAILSLLSFATASILAPLVMWFIYKDKPGYGFTKEASRRAFQLQLLPVARQHGFLAADGGVPRHPGHHPVGRPDGCGYPDGYLPQPGCSGRKPR